MSFYLGIDLGTSSVKLLLIGADQAIIGSSHAPLDVQRPHPGWSEQDPGKLADRDGSGDGGAEGAGTRSKWRLSRASACRDTCTARRC